jgi:uncharacterized protein (TIGR03083 family)
MSERTERLRVELHDARAYLLSVAEQIGPDQVLNSTENPLWNIHDLLAHLAGAERGMQATVRRFLASEALPENFSLDYWNQRQVEKQKERTVPDLLAALAASRVDTLALLASLTDEQLAVRGMHPAGFESSVGGIFKVIAHHERGHGQEIALALGLPVENRVKWG